MVNLIYVTKGGTGTRTTRSLRVMMRLIGVCEDKKNRTRIQRQGEGGARSSHLVMQDMREGKEGKEEGEAGKKWCGLEAEERRTALEEIGSGRDLEGLVDGRVEVEACN